MIFKVDHITTLGDEHIVTFKPLDLMALETGTVQRIDVHCSGEGIKRFVPGFTFDVAITRPEEFKTLPQRLVEGTIG